MNYIIPIHSFVDFITNSSTEIYVTASKKTASAVKDLIDEILKIGGSKYTHKDFFKIRTETTCRCREEGYLEEGEKHDTESCESAECQLVVTPIEKEQDNPELTKVLKMLNNLVGLFEYGERAN